MRQLSHFFAWLARMKFIRRWSLMRNTHPENIAEHSHRVATIAHALAILRNTRHGGSVDADRAAALALYHDANEVFTGDLPTPVKYTNPTLRDAYHAIEEAAAARLADTLPTDLQAAFRPYLLPDPADPAAAELTALVKAADKLCAWLKCTEELAAGNREFASAERSLKHVLEGLDVPEVQDFMAEFAPGFRLNLDELQRDV